MPVKKKKLDGLLLLAIITTALGLLGGMAFANLSHINFNEDKNANAFNFLGQALSPGGDTAPSFKSIFEFILTGWTTVIASFAVLSIMIGAFMFVSASANEELAKKGKQIITLTLMGLIFASFAYLIVKLVVFAFYPTTLA